MTGQRSTRVASVPAEYLLLCAPLVASLTAALTGVWRRDSSVPVSVQIGGTVAFAIAARWRSH
jgi:hypothetical protein